MNKNLFFSSFISISLHGMLFIVPFHSIFIKDINIDVIKAPASIEISIVNSVPSVEVRVRKIDTIPLKKLEGKEEIKDPEKKKTQKSITTKPMIGAITEQISSLMINKPPTYPTLARVKGWEGEVRLIAKIGQGGRVSRVNILSSSGFYILDKAAQKAIETWQFRDITSPTQVEIPVKFVLTNK